jgi:hypothetical protein
LDLEFQFQFEHSKFELQTGKNILYYFSYFIFYNLEFHSFK